MIHCHFLLCPEQRVGTQVPSEVPVTPETAVMLSRTIACIVFLTAFKAALAFVGDVGFLHYPAGCELPISPWQGSSAARVTDHPVLPRAPQCNYEEMVLRPSTKFPVLTIGQQRGNCIGICFLTIGLLYSVTVGRQTL